jgi:hypothetical protein
MIDQGLKLIPFTLREGCSGWQFPWVFFGGSISGWIREYYASASCSQRTWNNRHQGLESFTSALGA